MNEKRAKKLRRLAFVIFCLPAAHGQHPTARETVSASVGLLDETPRTQRRVRILAIRKGVKKGLVDPDNGNFHCGTCGNRGPDHGA